MTRLPANKWVTVGSCFGLTQQLLHIVVDTETESFHLFNQTAQIRCLVETRYEAQHDRASDIVSVAH